MGIRPRKQLAIYAIILILIAGISVLSNILHVGPFVYSILVMIPILLAAILSFIPIYKEIKLDINKSKNRLTEEEFTDRENDLEHLLKLLSSQEHRIEIKGNEANCGKTWLAMRLCDYINNPKDKSFKKYEINIPYKRARYFDLKKYTSEKLEDFFNSSIITSKDVLIFDHVEDIKMLINKQESYHFQMIYLMNKPSNTDLSSHYISKFNIKNLDELHKRIRSTHPTLEELTENEFKTLYDLTNGNIGRISGIISEQRCIEWLKDITNGSKTEYDIELDKIQIELFIGKYSFAKELLDKFESKYCDKINIVMDIKYKYLLMRSDCEHLLNNYNDALSILSTIEIRDYNSYNKNYEIELHKAHYLKHLWCCNEALEILQNIKNDSYSAIVDSLGILAAKYFIDDLHVNFTDKTSIEVYRDYYICAENSILEHNQADVNKLKRHKAIYTYYKDNPSDMEELILFTNNIIDIYKAENNRLLANALFIQGEIYRLYKEYDSAIVSYDKCLNITHDNNIIIQVNLMVYYLKNIKKLDLKFDIISNETIIKFCECNNYADKIYRRIKCIEHNDPNAKKISTCFDSRIMPIL